MIVKNVLIVIAIPPFIADGEMFGTATRSESIRRCKKRYLHDGDGCCIAPQRDALGFSVKECP